MSNRAVLSATLEVITPVFCAGAEQNGPAEIRPFSLRGALRWWYRAIDKDFAAHEAEFFGAAGTQIKSSPVTLRLTGWVSANTDYSQQLNPRKATQRGDAYLGYTLYLGTNQRKAVPVDRRVGVQLVQRSNNQNVRRAWAASLWLFGHLGGLGTRSRRGFGTMALTAWSGWPECDDLPVAHGAKSADEWKRALNEGFGRIRKWFSGPTNASHHHLGQVIDVRLWRDGFADWGQSLDAAGTEFRKFRNDSRNHKPALLAAFGLPLAFTRSQKDQVIPGAKDFGRAPSRLQFRVIKIAGRYHPLVWTARGPLMPGAVTLVWKNRKLPLAYGGDGLIDGFLKHIAPKCVPQ